MKSLQQSKGLTLIEVLIALAILSIALTAVIQATAQNIKNTLYLQNRTIATWIATDVVNNVRAGVLKLSADSNQTQKKVVLGQEWSYDLAINSTPNPHIKKIDVTVIKIPDNKQFAHLEGYLYAS